MLRILSICSFPFLIVSCNYPSPQMIYTVSAIRPKEDGTTEYLMRSERGDKLIVKKNGGFPWELGKKIYLEGDLSK